MSALWFLLGFLVGLLVVIVAALVAAWRLAAHVDEDRAVADLEHWTSVARHSSTWTES